MVTATERRLLGVIALVTLAEASPLAQRNPSPPALPAGTSAIRGRVVDSVTKQPVAGCTLRAGAATSFTNLTSDLGGAYELKDVAAGEYFFLIRCPAHLPLCMAAGPYSCRVEVSRDQEREGTDFLVVPGAIARGQVMTSDGRPVTRASVRLGRGIEGEPTYMAMPSITDTEGRFELLNLPAGEWRLEVEIPPVPGGLRPPTVYYPGGLSWEEARGVTLEAGKVTERLTITVPRINENTLTVVVPPADATISDLTVSVLQASPLAVRQIDLDAEGVGVIKGVLPGRYFVSARAASRDRQWAAFEVVDFIEDTYEARLQLLPTGHIAGRIVVDRGDLPPLDGVIVGGGGVGTPAGAEINPTRVEEAPVAADGSFRINNLFGTRQLQLRALGLEWEVAAVRQGRADVTSSGVLVVPDATTPATIVLRRR